MPLIFYYACHLYSRHIVEALDRHWSTCSKCSVNIFQSTDVVIDFFTQYIQMCRSYFTCAEPTLVFHLAWKHSFMTSTNQHWTFIMNGDITYTPVTWALVNLFERYKNKSSVKGFHSSRVMHLSSFRLKPQKAHSVPMSACTISPLIIPNAFSIMCIYKTRNLCK